jgi:APA family basic amino acid/polyamine antiporter
VPRSGGEYRYISTLIHPSLGGLAGWISLFVGFSAPVAVNALSAAAFLGTIIHVSQPKLLAIGLVVLLTLFHAINLSASKLAQNSLILVKVALLIGFVAVGFALGDNSLPNWQPPNPEKVTPLSAFMISQFWIAFAFSGWNAAIYAAEEFESPARDVSRSMLIGCSLVGLGYLLVNWVFVANLSPAQAGEAVFDQSKTVTLGHAVVQSLIGPEAGALMSGVTVIAFVSAMSAMTMMGPRVYSEMAADGFLPRALAARAGRPPVASLLFQSAVTIVLVFKHDIDEVLTNVGAILTIVTALAMVGLFVPLFRPQVTQERPRPIALITAAAYIGFSIWALYFAFTTRESLLLWLSVIAAVALLNELFSLRRRRAQAKR